MLASKLLLLGFILCLLLSSIWTGRALIWKSRTAVETFLKLQQGSGMAGAGLWAKRCMVDTKFIVEAYLLGSGKEPGLFFTRTPVISGTSRHCI